MLKSLTETYSDLEGKCNTFLFFWSLRGVMTKLLNCSLEVCEFELYSRYYVHYGTNTIGKTMNLFIPPEMHVIGVL